MSNKTFVAILMGSDSDLPILENTIKVLKHFAISYELRIASAHRTPNFTHSYIKDAEARGCAVFIAAAGLAAHLAGAIAAHTVKPVIGIPIDTALGGLDALLSTVQMPGGIPVATVAIGSAGAKNAAYLTLQILAVYDKELHDKLLAERKQNAQAILAKNDIFSLS